MNAALCRKQYNAPLARRSERERDNIDWATQLPPEWIAQVVVPLSFDVFRDYEIAALRTLGRDEDGNACFHAYRFIVHEPRSDDDEEFYQVAVYGESLTAWRLRDGRWLAHRLIGREGSKGRAFFSLGERLPSLCETTGWQSGLCLA
jgi:hypothetical protein